MGKRTIIAYIELCQFDTNKHTSIQDKLVPEAIYITMAKQRAAAEGHAEMTRATIMRQYLGPLL